MYKFLVFAAMCLSLAGCKKECESESYGVVTFKNLSEKALNVKVNNAIPRGCLSASNGNLEPGAECGAELTANLQHAIVVRSDNNTVVYWQFEMSVGPCGDRVIEIY